jgi:toluene monooxygenase system protein D
VRGHEAGWLGTAGASCCPLDDRRPRVLISSHAASAVKYGQEVLNIAVGPVLKMSGGRADYIVSAIRDDNPDTSLEVVDYGRIVRVQAPRYLRVTRATLQWDLGPNFDLTALESMIVSSVGHITRTSEQLIWHDGATSSSTPVVPDDR